LSKLIIKSDIQNQTYLPEREVECNWKIQNVRDVEE